MESKGILNYIKLPHKHFGDQWDKIFVPDEIKNRLLSQAILEFTVRGKLSHTSIPLHGLILLVGPPGTGKTSLARGLGHRVAESLSGSALHFLEVEPHSLASSALGKSQQGVRDLLQKTVAEHAAHGPLIVLLDEVETLAADRRRMSLEANPVDVHRATDAVLASVDLLAAKYPHLLFVATSNFEQAVDEAFMSRVDLIEFIGKPDATACREIVTDTLNVLGTQWPKVARLSEGRGFETAVKEAVGLDGREIRKAVLSACTFSKDVALDPDKLSMNDLVRSIRHKKQKRSI